MMKQKINNSRALKWNKMSIKKKEISVVYDSRLMLVVKFIYLNAQSAEIQQLILDWQKLAQLRKILATCIKVMRLSAKGILL